MSAHRAEVSGPDSAGDDDPGGGPDLFESVSVDGLTDDQLSERVVGYAGQIAALTARFLQLLAEFDRRGVWHGDGILSCAQWLSWRVGLSLRTAQEYLRIAHALNELPELREAFAHGVLSYSKVRALTRVTTPEREHELLTLALNATAAQVERFVRSMRRHDRRSAERASAIIESSGQWRWNEDGTLSVSLRLTALDGARLLAGAVRAEYERTRTQGDVDVPLDHGERRSRERGKPQGDLWRHVPRDIAPAVVAMSDTVRSAVHIPEIAPGAEVLIHTSADDHVALDPHLDDGPALDDAAVDEARCGAAVRAIRTERSGTILRWGRKRRTPNAALVRVITQRDRGCRHPGCGRTRHLHVHHVRPWADGGTTDPDNLLLLCGTHHRALHRGVFRIVAHGRQHFTFHDRGGSVIENAPRTSIPRGWRPDGTIAVDASSPMNPGRLDLAYTSEVLAAVWEHKARHSASTAA